ncbi:MAG: ammonia-forming cytochrome c nitrite reductase subunit c552, partial [Gemmataceae bacterium]|nr:ammonia-forming cytochrome c nitrite reductase subunit c552 [Gemmataceae bacterium]
MTDTPSSPSRFAKLLYPATIVVVAGLTFGVVALLFNIRDRQREGDERFVQLVELDETSVDPALWGRNFPRQYDGYVRTVDMERTRHGGNEAIDKLAEDPRLIRLFAGYAFSKDYRALRGHAYMLKDQEQTQRVVVVNQPGSCLHCHSSVMPLYRKIGQGDVMKGFREVCAMDWNEAHTLVDHPVSCLDCHDPKTAQLRVTRPAFILGIQELAHFLADQRKTKED